MVDGTGVVVRFRLADVVCLLLVVTFRFVACLVLAEFDLEFDFLAFCFGAEMLLL